MKIVGHCFFAVVVWGYLTALCWIDACAYGMIYVKSEEGRLIHYKKMRKVIFVVRAGLSTALGVLTARVVDMLFF